MILEKPIDLNTWWSNNEPDEKLIYRDGLPRQCSFIKDSIMYRIFLRVVTDYGIYSKKLMSLHYGDPEYNKIDSICTAIYDNFIPMVIATHTSKSVRLPVFELTLNKDEVKLKILLRNNFYDWCISVESNIPIEHSFLGLVDKVNVGYFEGFPKERIYDRYDKSDHQKFSVVLDSDYEVYTFMMCIAEFIKEITKKDGQN